MLDIMAGSGRLRVALSLVEDAGEMVVASAIVAFIVGPMWTRQVRHVQREVIVPQ
jgi:hypothetical protein